MTLSRNIRTAPSRVFSVFSFAACARVLGLGSSGYPAHHLSDEILCDIGLSRCLLIAGFCEAAPVSEAD